METCADYNADKYSDAEEDVESLQTDQLAACMTNAVKKAYLEFAEDMYRVPKGVKEVVTEIQQWCGDYAQDVEK